MRLLASMLFSVFLVVMSTSWHVDVHLCHNNVQSISVGHGDLDCEDEKGCGKCCDNIHFEYLADYDYTTFQTWTLEKIVLTHYSQELSVESEFKNNDDLILGFSNSSPPPKRKIYITFHQLLFYS